VEGKVTCGSSADVGVPRVGAEDPGRSRAGRDVAWGVAAGRAGEVGGPEGLQPGSLSALTDGRSASQTARDFSLGTRTVILSMQSCC